jgi:hypothetical protein
MASHALSLASSLSMTIGFCIAVAGIITAGIDPIGCPDSTTNYLFYASVALFVVSLVSILTGCCEEPAYIIVGLFTCAYIVSTIVSSLALSSATDCKGAPTGIMLIVLFTVSLGMAWVDCITFLYATRREP